MKDPRGKLSAASRWASADGASRSPAMTYVSADGSVSVVSSADFYEFDADGLITMITSYAVELEA